MRQPDFPNMCGAADWGPGAWGHKCIKPKHPRSEEHKCACKRTWMEPTDAAQ